MDINNENTVRDVIIRLFNELSLKYGKYEGDIVLSYQNNALFACEQDYDNLKILEEITFNEQ